MRQSRTVQIGPYNSDARQLGIYFSTLARFDHSVHDILSGKKKDHTAISHYWRDQADSLDLT